MPPPNKLFIRQVVAGQRPLPRQRDMDNAVKLVKGGGSKHKDKK